MKRLALSLLLLGTVTWAVAVPVKLKITYNGAGVAGNDVTIKHGDIALGSGRTDAGGNVTINASQLLSNSIDVYGSVQTDNGSKTWDVKGWVALDDNNYAELKFEELFAEMGIPAGMFAEAWGLTFSTQGQAAPAAEKPAPVASKPKETETKPTEAPAKGNAAPALPTGYTCNPVSAAQVSATQQQVEAESFGSGKVDLVRDFMDGHCYDAAQAKQLIALITMETDRLELAKHGYGAVANQQDYEATVGSALSMELSRRELHDYIASRGSGKPKGGGTGSPATGSTPATTPKPNPTDAGANMPDKMTFRTENGEKFTLYVNGAQVNASPDNNVSVGFDKVATPLPKIKVVFEDSNIPQMEKKALLGGFSNQFTYLISKNKKDEWVLRQQF